MKGFSIGVIAVLVGLGLGYVFFHGPTANAPVGGLFEVNTPQFGNGFAAGGSSQLSVDSSGVLAATSAKNRGRITLSGGTGTATVASGAICVATDETATSSVTTMATTTGTTLTVKGNGSDTVHYVCF